MIAAAPLNGTVTGTRVHSAASGSLPERVGQGRSASLTRRAAAVPSGPVEWHARATFPAESRARAAAHGRSRLPEPAGPGRHKLNGRTPAAAAAALAAVIGAPTPEEATLSSGPGGPAGARALSARSVRVAR